MLLLGEFMFSGFVTLLSIGCQTFSAQFKSFWEAQVPIQKFLSLELNHQNTSKNLTLTLLKQEQDFVGNKELQNSSTSHNMKSNPEIFQQSLVLMEQIKSYNMVQDHMQDIQQLFWKLMECLVLSKVKMVGTGRNMEFREMIGKLGRNGLLTAI